MNFTVCLLSRNIMKFAHLHEFQVQKKKSRNIFSWLYYINSWFICWLKSRHSKVSETVFIFKFSLAIA